MKKVNWKDFGVSLTDWYRPERRPMPWKQEGDPYRVWLSEIILQQTRVEQGLPYFERFVEACPTVTDLAAAPDDEVMKLWEGLGYYSRARNLLRAARHVAHDLGGKFPDTYNGLLGLPGVGPYTAAAIASFAFGRQVAVLDGNVFRVLARYAADATPIDTGGGRRYFQALVDNALEGVPAATFNQAIMDFGALICTPRRASCNICPLSNNCLAFANDVVYELPVKSKKLVRRDRFFHYLVVTDAAERTIIGQRTEKDIWQGLYQYPLVETDSAGLTAEQLVSHKNWPEWLLPQKLNWGDRSQSFQHQLTHQRISVVFHSLELSATVAPPDPYLWSTEEELAAYAFPRVITKYRDDNTLTLGF